MGQRPRALYVMGTEAFDATYGPDERRRIETLVEIVAPPQTPESALLLPRETLAAVEVLVSGWGAPRLDAAWLARLPALAALFHGAGSVARVMTIEAWARGIVVTTAAEANAVPVAEYTLAMIVLCLKRAWRTARELRALHDAPSRADIPGCRGAVVGLISLGTIGRLVAKYLATLDVSILAFDPHVSRHAAEDLGATFVPLDDVFRKSEVVSIHAPRLRETEGMITGQHLSSLNLGASVINTSNGAVIREDEMIAVAAARSDLQFVLDVTAQMPPHPASPLYTLPNVLLTPHIAGSRGRECRRMGQWIVHEIERYVRGVPLVSRVSIDAAHATSHWPATPEIVGEHVR